MKPHAQRIVFTEEQLSAICEMFESGVTLNAIGREYNVSGATIKKNLQQLGYTDFSNKRTQLSELDVDAFISDYHNGLTRAELMKKYNVSEWTLYRVMEQYDLPRRKYHLHEIATDEELAEIERLAAENHSVALISSALGFSKDMIMWHLDANGIPRGHGKIAYYKGIMMRSSWEVLFARYLDSRGYYWEYEPIKFDLGSRKYTPDFLVVENGEKVIYEVKGRVSDKDCRRSLLFAELYPEIPYYLVCEDEIKVISGILDKKEVA